MRAVSRLQQEPAEVKLKGFLNISKRVGGIVQIELHMKGYGDQAVWQRVTPYLFIDQMLHTMGNSYGVVYTVRRFV